MRVMIKITLNIFLLLMGIYSIEVMILLNFTNILDLSLKNVVF